MKQALLYLAQGPALRNHRGLLWLVMPTFGLFLVLLLTLTAYAASSDNYSILQQAADSAGVDSQTGSFSIKSQVGQAVAGRSTSQNYIIDHGSYWEVTPASPSPSGGGGGPAPGGSSDNGSGQDNNQTPTSPAGSDNQTTQHSTSLAQNNSSGGNQFIGNGSASQGNGGGLNQNSSQAGNSGAGSGGSNSGKLTTAIGNYLNESLQGVTSAINSLISDVTQTLQQAQEIIQRSAQAVLQILPASQAAVENTAKTSAAVLLPVQVAVQSSASLVPLLSGGAAMADGWLVFLKLWYLLAVFLGLKRRQQRRGTVYDSQSKQPIDPAIVELIDADSGQVVDKAITDMAGRYGFIVGPGRYVLSVKKTHYEFPSKKLLDTRDEIFDSLYHGEPLEVKADSQLLAPNIPMDPVAFDWNQEEKQKLLKFHPHLEQALSALFAAVFWSGFVLLTVVTLARTSVFYYGLLLLYIFVAVLRVSNTGTRLWGRVYDSRTGRLMPGLLLELSPPGFSVATAKAKSGPGGKFFLKAHKGNYRLSVKQGSGETEHPLKTTEVKVKRREIFNQDIAV